MLRLRIVPLLLLLLACGKTPRPAIEQSLRALVPATQVEGRAYPPATVEQLLARHKVPAVSVAVIEDGRVSWANAWGTADVEEQRKATTATLFQAASISKPVAATAALTLVDDGVLRLDDDVNAKLRTWRVPPFAFGEQVTLRRLLSHTAGLTVHGFPGYSPNGAVPAAVQVLEGVPPANTPAVRVDIEPGSEWRYSGGGYVVLQTLLSDVTGKPFPTLMRERVLGPAGMHASTYEQPLPAAARAHAATAYHGDGKAVEGKHHLYPEMAAAGLWTTPSELARWVLALDELLAPETLKAMFTEEKADFGLGIAVRGRRRSLQVSHGGSNEGYRCTLVYYPRRGEGVVIMTNSDNGDTLVDPILHAVARRFDWPGYEINVIEPIAVAATTLAGYTGTYRPPDVPMDFVVTLENGTLFLTFSNSTTELVPVEKDAFESVKGGRLRFERDASGKVTALLLGSVRVPKVTSSPPT